METYRCILSRRTVRYFKDEPLSLESVKKIVNAGRYAPSPLNLQPWEIIVLQGKARERASIALSKCTAYLDDIIAAYHEDITDEAGWKEAREQLKDEMREFFLEIWKAPVLIVILMPGSKHEALQKDSILANGCVIQNMQLAAWEMGIGCVCLTSADAAEAELKEIIGAKSGQIMTILAIGYPQEGRIVKTERRADNCRWIAQ